jgi:hypothetical protein
MIRRIRAAILWAKIFHSYKKADYESAKRYADSYRQIANDAVFRALDAAIDILNHDSATAETKLQDLSNYLADIPGEDSRYIGSYAEYYLALIRKDRNADRHRIEALSISTSAHVKKWLSLPPSEVSW